VIGCARRHIDRDEELDSRVISRRRKTEKSFVFQCAAAYRDGQVAQGFPRRRKCSNEMFGTREAT